MNDTDRIKEKLDIVEFIQQYIPLKKAGRNFSASCPFHAEKSPSFVVSPDRQIWHCFGACNEGGDIFSFFMKQERVDFLEALHELADRAGITLEHTKRHDPQAQERDRMYEMLHLASEYYHFLLMSHELGKEGRSYIKQRGISDKVVKSFMLGYAPNGWQNIYPFLKKKGYTEVEMEKAGLIKSQKNRWYDRFRGRLIFTLYDHRGQITGFSGRVLVGNKQAKYINSPETLVYHKGRQLFGLYQTCDAIKKAGFAIIVEGEFDVLNAFQHGISNIVAIKGTALTNEQLRLIKRFTPEIRLAFDMDIAGDAAVRRSIALAESLDIAVTIVKIPHGKDIDEALAKSERAVKKAIEAAQSVYDFVLESACLRFDIGTATGKKNICADVIPLYARITNPIIKGHYIKHLAEVINMSENTIMAEFNRIQKQQQLHMPIASKQDHDPITNDHIQEQYILSMIIQSNNPTEYLQKIEETRTIDTLQSSPIRRIFEQIVNASPEQLQHIDSLLPQELIDTYNRAYLKDIHAPLDDAILFNKELNRIIIVLKKRHLKNELVRIAGHLKDENDVQLHNKAFNEISLELKKLSSI